MSFAVCVYCGSRNGKDATMEAVARDLGVAIAESGWRLVYGGGHIGLMGVVARHVRDHGGEVIGVIPQALVDRELAMHDATELVVTETLRQRKAVMDERSDAFIALPGGFGTLEELVETLTLRQLGYHNKPIIILNQQGYYDPLLTLFEHAVEQGFASHDQLGLYQAVPNVAAAVAVLKSHVLNARHEADQGRLG